MCVCVCVYVHTTRPPYTYVRTYKGVELKSGRHNNGNSAVAAWPPRHLCYCPAVFFCHLRLIALSFPQAVLKKKSFHFNSFKSCKIACL